MTDSRRYTRYTIWWNVTNIYNIVIPDNQSVSPWFRFKWVANNLVHFYFLNVIEDMETVRVAWIHLWRLRESCTAQRKEEKKLLIKKNWLIDGQRWLTMFALNKWNSQLWVINEKFNLYSQNIPHYFVNLKTLFQFKINYF